MLLRKKRIKIYGIQHGGSYNLVDYNFLHKVSDLDFCDKYLSYGVSNKVYTKKIINFGSFKSIYYENQMKKFNNNENMNLFVIGAINENYPNRNNPFLQFKFQKEVYKYLKVTKTKTVIKLPQIFDNIKYQILDNIEQNNDKIFFSKLKIFKAINFYKPNITILDRYSTTWYECLFYDIEIIMFLDKKEIPYPDVLNILKKEYMLFIH